MSELITQAELGQHLAQLKRAVSDRLIAEQAIEQNFGDPVDARHAAMTAAITRREAEHQLEIAEIDQRAEEQRQQIEARFDQEQAAADEERRRARNEVERRTREEVAQVTQKHDDAKWVAQSVLDETSEDSPKRQFDRIHNQLTKSHEQQETLYQALHSDVQAAMEDRNWSRDPPPPPESAPNGLDPLAELFMASIDAGRDELAKLAKLRVPKLFLGMRPLWLFIALLVATGVPGYLFIEPSMVGVQVAQTEGTWVGMVAGATFGLSLLLLTILYTLSSMQLSDVFSSMLEETTAASFYHQQWTQAADRERIRKRKDLDAKQKKMEVQLGEQLQRYESVHRQTLDDAEQQRQSQLADIEREASTRTAQIAKRRATELSDADYAHRQQIGELTQRFESDHGLLQHRLQSHLTERQTAHQRARAGMTSTWNESLDTILTAEVAARQQSDSLFRDWPALTGDGWEPPRIIPPGLRLGTYDIDLAKMQGGISTDAALIPTQTRLRFPFVLPFPNGASLLMKTDGPDSRRAAVRAMQVYVLRMLTLLPPGKLRLTVFDPIGLGESFSGLMHLADYDELLITSRIWTEAAQFEAQLANLTEHMENVLQKYLRNEFPSIEAYNDFAGEVAEPYHVLVVADFPNKFSEQAAQRLTSIATSGPRCGVYLLMSADPSQSTPHGFDLDDVETAATTLEWASPAQSSRRPDGNDAGESDRESEDHLSTHVDWVADEQQTDEVNGPEVDDGRLGDEPAFYLNTNDVALARWPIVIDGPPPPETFTQIVKTVGKASKDVRRVEVSFGRIAPSPDDVWSRDSRSGIDIPLGRAGATKLQHLRLGKGTSQHMLVAGKTGSGKSTFFHALITNAALHYSPNELEFYLVDFKKGVEFKAYAGGKLPHARVIAIESDREFGISVLQRLDGILHERGELFRELGVQDISGFRGARPASHMPRILLVIDEFQEFFTEDDRFSQQAALLLDRLVRQGRAFGIHVILGSQTLGGAYSLARSTLGQVAVRVALQCSEADAHLILSESNTAARLLTRPGEAIYNDSNGTVEGNHPFQIAWLPDEEREGYLGVMQHFARQQGMDIEPPLVFEGNIPSDPSDNTRLSRLIASDDVVPLTAPTVWLGDAVEIGPPTFVELPPQAGSNLLIVGQDPHAATGILATSYLALAAQLPSPNGAAADDPTVDSSSVAPLWIFDANHVGSTEAGFWKQLAGVRPEQTRLVTPGNVRQALGDLTAEMERRRADDGTEHSPLFVLVGSLSKFRDLRKGDDDYGFSGFGSSESAKPADPAKQFADLIAGGPEQGMHLLAWVDSAGNLDRWLSRQSLKEFELRITFAMNAGDSSNLIDSPAAAKLGPHRALLYREETGTTTKFRPYGPPSEDWLNHVRLHLSASHPLESALDLDGFQVT